MLSVPNSAFSRSARLPAHPFDAYMRASAAFHALIFFAFLAGAAVFGWQFVERNGPYVHSPREGAGLYITMTQPLFP
jgi:hypothetical protein